MRKQIVAGNWKMNTTPSEGLVLTKELVQNFNNESVELIIAPPFTHLSEISKALLGSKIILSSQNIAKEQSGAFTGEISANMLKGLSVTHCIIGHSERRSYYNETDEIISEKVNTALESDLIPIFCIGENQKEREENQHFDVIERQLEKGLSQINASDVQNIIIAYEPVWAIGTGLTATPKQAQEIHAFIRSFIQKKYNDNIAENISILYGGSCKPNNAKSLFAQKDIDGGLIGGAALNAKDFLSIANNF